ncbi:MAG: hypothetical protein WAL98_13140 [Desulfatiglandaceae bacterium]|jgi:hypothetical protein
MKDCIRVIKADSVPGRVKILKVFEHSARPGLGVIGKAGYGSITGSAAVHNC